MKKNEPGKLASLKYMNKLILFLTLFFCVAGALLILDASSISSVLVYGFDTPYYYFGKQMLFIGIGLVMSFFVLLVDTKWYKLFGFLLSVISIALLGITFIKEKIFTSGVSEVTLSLFGGRFQPGEFLKVFLIMYMGAFYGIWANKQKKNQWSFLIPLIPCAFSFLLIALGGDLGSAAIMLALYALVFVCVPTKEKWFRRFKRIAIGGLILSVFALKFAYKIIPESTLESSYRLNRFIYTNPCDRYEENSGYQVCNGYIAIDNGGLLGVGPGKSVQKYMYLPASHTDFIFPIVVEELGAIVGVVIILAYMWLIALIFKVALKTKNLQNSIICYGIAIYFMLHIFVNLGGVLGIIPLTGVPLPFLSYGGSFCITVLCSFAIVQRIHIENEIERHKNA